MSDDLLKLARSETLGALKLAKSACDAGNAMLTFADEANAGHKWARDECRSILTVTRLAVETALARHASQFPSLLDAAPAQGIETRRAETEGLGAKPESPVGEADAPPLST